MSEDRITETFRLPAGTDIGTLAVKLGTLAGSKGYGPQHRITWTSSNGDLPDRNMRALGKQIRAVPLARYGGLMYASGAFRHGDVYVSWGQAQSGDSLPDPVMMVDAVSEHPIPEELVEVLDAVLPGYTRRGKDY